MYEFFSSTRWKDIRETLDGGSYVWRMVGEEETADLRPEVLFPALAAKVLAKMLRSNLAWGFKHFQNNIFNPKPHYWANLSIFQWMRSSIMWSDNWLSVVSNFKQSNFKNGFSLLNCHEFGSCEGSGALQVKILIWGWFLALFANLLCLLCLSAMWRELYPRWLTSISALKLKSVDREERKGD